MPGINDIATVESPSTSLRFRALGNIQSESRSLRYSTMLVESPGTSLRYSSTRQIQSLNQVRYTSTTEVIESIWQYGTHPTDPDSMPQISILAGGTELCPAPHVLQVQHQESAPARWTLAIQDHEGYYHPKNAGSPWAGVMTRNKQTMIATVDWEGASYSVSGLSTHYGHARSFTSAGSIDFTWSGIDRSSKLFATGQTLQTIRTKGSIICTTKDAVAELLTAAGIPCNLDGMESTPIRMQHRQDGRIGDWIQALLDVLWHKWIMIGGVFYAYKPNYFGPPTWTYGGDEAFILEDSLSSDAPTFCNQVIARRAKEANGGTSSPVEHQEFGQFTQTFNPPLEGIFWRKLQQQGGRFTDFRLYRNDALIAIREASSSYTGGGLTTAGSGIIDKVIYTWGTLPGQSTTGGYGKIQFLGAGQDQEGSVFGTDQTYARTRQNLTSIAAGDDLNSQELSPSTLIGDGALLLRHADGFLIEKAAEQEPIDYRVALNLRMLPGQRMSVVDTLLGTETRYIRGVTHTFSDDPNQRMTRAQTVAIPNISIGTP